MSDFGVYYTCYTEGEAVEYSLEDFNSTINELENLHQLLELASNENNTSVIKDCENNILLLLNQIKKTEVSCFLSGVFHHFG